MVWQAMPEETADNTMYANDRSSQLPYLLSPYLYFILLIYTLFSLLVQGCLLYQDSKGL